MARQSFHKVQDPTGEMVAVYCIGQTYLLQGHRQGAAEVLQRYGDQMPFGVVSFDSWTLAVALKFAEQVQGTDAFRAMCARWRESHHRLTELGLAQWHLEPVGALAPPDLERGRLVWADSHAAALDPEWEWRDPSGDCSFLARDGLQIRAANGRDLHHINLTAPCILRSVPASAVVQTVCGPVSAEQPAIGGILFWKDRDSFVRLDWGSGGSHEITLRGCLGGHDVVLGRGLLPPGLSQEGILGLAPSGAQLPDASGGSGEAQLDPSTAWPAMGVFLRVECVAGQLAAFCSRDASEWFLVGHATLPGEGAPLVGVYASGNIDRLVYPGAYPDGTAIRFGPFYLSAI